jgi:hypothetical protein
MVQFTSSLLKLRVRKDVVWNLSFRCVCCEDDARQVMATAPPCCVYLGAASLGDHWDDRRRNLGRLHPLEVQILGGLAHD